MAVQLVEDCVVAVLEHEVKLPFAPKHLDQIHQVGVFQLLQRHKNTEKERKRRLREIQQHPHKHSAAKTSKCTICGLLLSNRLNC